ncbi:MAG: HAD hydrolase family protein [Magnetococcales bacterium]|nr:HAD hydrolase family protein [Magnetococcales bacterium]
MRARVEPVRLLALDVDGVLTDGGLYYLDHEGLEAKRFHARDGLGIRLLLESGLLVGWITARRSELVAKRARELGITFLHQGAHDKWRCLRDQLRGLSLEPDQCAYMGDDLVDLAVMQRVGLAAAPGDAHPEAIRAAHWVASEGGGRGAVRALIDTILQIQGHWPAILERMSAASGAP